MVTGALQQIQRPLLFWAGLEGFNRTTTKLQGRLYGFPPRDGSTWLYHCQHPESNPHTFLVPHVSLCFENTSICSPGPPHGSAWHLYFHAIVSIQVLPDAIFSAGSILCFMNKLHFPSWPIVAHTCTQAHRNIYNVHSCIYKILQCVNMYLKFVFIFFISIILFTMNIFVIVI